ncbi:MAG: tRNA (guanosine(37)-N1)-methyltransferase TrmD [Thermodesulfobacteria bacterium]|nr:tRNA (guanosine(37)-N1)-methyltransferase TrmD [Thermodesulfobacteriota bacterium]
MKFSVITIFPEYFESPLKVGLLGKAIQKGLIEVEVLNLRDFAEGKHRVVDDEPYGGGEGMVFKPEPLAKAIESIKKASKNAWVINLSPQGDLLNQELVERLSKKKHLVLICGRYEGIDERIRQKFVDQEISIGDYVVFGGEVASLTIIEAVSRLIPGVVGRKDSVEKESFSSGLLKYPCYTRPREFMGEKVPEVLLSGNHKKIEEYRFRVSLEVTLRKRPELLKRYPLKEEQRKIVNDVLSRQKLYLFLLHYPVYNKRKEVIASATANMDLHDLARLARTYDLRGVFIIQPLEDQRSLIEELKNYWINGFGANYNPLRKEAIKLISVFENLEQAIKEVEKREGKKPVLLGTDASPKRQYTSIEKVRELLWESPIALVLGTAWGLCEEVLSECDYFLEPLWGRLDSYNHLSVRSAAAIYLEKLLGIYCFYKKN